jgi:hypothetical protein
MVADMKIRYVKMVLEYFLSNIQDGGKIQDIFTSSDLVAKDKIQTYTFVKM